MKWESNRTRFMWNKPGVNFQTAGPPWRGAAGWSAEKTERKKNVHRSGSPSGGVSNTVGREINSRLVTCATRQVWRGVRLGADGKPSSAEGYVLKRMLLEKGQHVLQAGIRWVILFAVRGGSTAPTKQTTTQRPPAFSFLPLSTKDMEVEGNEPLCCSVCVRVRMWTRAVSFESFVVLRLPSLFKKGSAP